MIRNTKKKKKIIKIIEKRGKEVWEKL